MIPLATICPNGHSHPFTRPLAEVRAEVAEGDLHARCGICALDYLLGPAEQCRALACLERDDLAPNVDGQVATIDRERWVIHLHDVAIEAVPFPPANAIVTFIATPDGQAAGRPVSIAVPIVALHDRAGIWDSLRLALQ